jgi:hypothetical protein
MKKAVVLVAALLLASKVYPDLTQRTSGITAGPEHNQQSSPILKGNPLRDAYYGDLHLHTSYSPDAYLANGTRVDPDQAYRFARGEPGRYLYLGEEVRRPTPPLDFLAVTDHSEYLGVLNTLQDPESPLSRSETGKELKEEGLEAFSRLGGFSSGASVPGVDMKAISQSAWQRTIEAANRNYQPGKFTTFIAYEWTAMKGGQWHRNIIFCGDKAPNPFTAVDSIKPEDLWNYLENIRKQGYEALAIPHNPNLSNGLMFDWVDSGGRRIDQAYAELRASNEPLIEISQNKGQSETLPGLSPNDEFANFEVLENLPFASMKTKAEGSYVRDGLGRGLEIAKQAGGINPFKYGFVGSSDFHTGLIDSSERAYTGLCGAVDPSKEMPELRTFAQRWTRGKAELVDQFTRYMYDSGSANLTGAWAEQNTRESIYAAFRRKETFATSGTRLKFRFFGGWGYRSGLLKTKDWVREAYRGGVPMGGDLPPQVGRQKAPTFMMWAAKDSNGANLDRLQIVKVWLENGKHAEKIFDVALSNGRKVDPETGKARPVGNTVDLRTATYSNTIGATVLSAMWQDPHFDPKVPAAYYLRVLEIPTPRWSTIVAVARRQPIPGRVPATIQERGWSSPIWYSPHRRSN